MLALRLPTGLDARGERKVLAGEADRIPSRASLWSLDALNFFLADVRDGLGPYLAIYLTSNARWDPSRVGIAMAAMLIGTIVVQTPAGALIDRVRWKRIAVALAAGLVALGCIVMIAVPTFPVVVGAQVAVGAAAAILAPAVAALSLGIVGHAKLAGRTGRNEAFNHAGNVAAAVLAGALGYLIGYWTIFYLVAAMAAASAASALLIRENDIDHALARGAAETEGARPASKVRLNSSGTGESSPSSPGRSCSTSPTRRCRRSWARR